MQLKIGIIGAGMAWEKLHYPAYTRLEDKFAITAICDTDIEKAKKAADMVRLPHSRAFDDADKMMSTVEMDAVDVMVPISDNYNVAKQAILKNKHVIAEKPLASTTSAAKELIKLSKKVKLLVAENYRYDEENNIIKKLLEDRTIGNALFFIDNNVTEFTKDMLKDSFAAKEWRQHPSFHGGIFLDSAVHHIARQRFLFGDAQSISAHGRHTDIDACPYSCINAMLSFNNDIVGHYIYCCISKETQAPLVGFRIFGTDGEIYLEDKNCGFVNLSIKTTGEHQAIPYKPNEGYYNELLNFYNAVVKDTTIISTPEKELGDIETVMEILKSAEKPGGFKLKRA